MQRFIATCILAFALTLTACSTIMEGSQEEVLLTTPGAPGSRCYVRNEYFLYVINPPRRFQLERTSKPYKIVCVAPGNRVKTVILPVGFERSTIYNVSNGVVPGVATDLASGALFRYPDEIAIDFTGIKPQPMPLPDYQQMLEANPLLKGMEQFRPGVPALQGDTNTAVTPMQKRDPNAEGDNFGSLLSPADVTGSASTSSGSSTSSPSSASTANTTGTNGGNVAPTVTGGASTGYGSFKSPKSSSSVGTPANPAGQASTNTTGSTSSVGGVTFRHSSSSLNGVSSTNNP